MDRVRNSVFRFKSVSQSRVTQFSFDIAVALFPLDWIGFIASLDLMLPP